MLLECTINLKVGDGLVQFWVGWDIPYDDTYSLDSIDGVLFGWVNKKTRPDKTAPTLTKEPGIAVTSNPCTIGRSHSLKHNALLENPKNVFVVCVCQALKGTRSAVFVGRVKLRIDHTDIHSGRFGAKIPCVALTVSALHVEHPDMCDAKIMQEERSGTGLCGIGCRDTREQMTVF